MLLKLFAGGAQDLWDVQQLRSAIGPELDAAVEAALPSVPAALRAAWATVTRT